MEIVQLSGLMYVLCQFSQNCPNVTLRISMTAQKVGDLMDQHAFKSIQTENHMLKLNSFVIVRMQGEFSRNFTSIWLFLIETPKENY